MGTMLGEAIRRRRKALGMKQADVAEIFDVTQQTVARWENGQRPDTDFVPAMATFLEVEDTAVLRLLITEDASGRPIDPSPIGLAGPRGWEQLSEKERRAIQRQIDELLADE